MLSKSDGWFSVFFPPSSTIGAAKNSLGFCTGAAGYSSPGPHSEPLLYRCHRQSVPSPVTGPRAPPPRLRPQTACWTTTPRRSEKAPPQSLPLPTLQEQLIRTRDSPATVSSFRNREAWLGRACGASLAPPEERTATTCVCVWGEGLSGGPEGGSSTAQSRNYTAVLLAL